MSFNKVNPKQNFPKMEEEILEFWEENKIFEKSVEREAPKGDYVFYDGPPFATGTPHYGHIVGSVMKDVVPRYFTMKGYRVERKWGWDCHGLPIENIAEKELGIKQKKDIEAMGVEKFNEFCRSKVLSYVSEWKKIITRLGRWADMENAYKTMDLPYMESIWHVFKELWEKGLIYEGYRSMHICTRCETTLSQQEVSEGYKDIKDLSAIAKFELIDPVKSSQSSDHGASEPKTFVLAWTTTPWTLIGNVALAVGENIDYVKVRFCHSELVEESTQNKTLKTLPKLDPSASSAADFVQDDNFYILAKERVQYVLMDRKYEIIEEFKGEKLVGKKYKPLFDYYSKDENLENRKNAAPATPERSDGGQGWQIYAADFVTTEEGTGVVHIAPAFGEDDLNLGKEKNLPFIQHVGMDGRIKKEATDFAGASVAPRAKDKPEEIRELDLSIIKFLDRQGKIFSSEKYLHSYPHCWRCDTPLINYATSSWFVNVVKIKNRAVELAKDINWSPEHMKEGRFGNWLTGARDWSISRQRFWASVMPIWKCECGEIKVIGSVKELEDLSGEKIEDLHKHTVDKITFKCEKCTHSTSSGQVGEMKRIPDVLDTWFDSGSMPYAQMHYPFENKEKFEQNFPAEFIAEGVDQTRAWFYYLHIIGTAIKDSRAFNNVIVNGIVVGSDGKKLSKRLKNYPDPAEMFEKYGADALRFYLMSSPVVAAENLEFKESDVADLVRGMFRMLWNSYSFFVLYANIDGWKPQDTRYKIQDTNNLLDRWIISELNVLIGEMNESMEKYELNKACRLLPKFVDNLSNWYIRRSRKRFWKSEDDADKNSAYQTLHYVLVELSKLMAPFTPFISEEIYRNLTNCHSELVEESNSKVDLSTPLRSAQDGKLHSVHLANFPVADEKLIDEKLNDEMRKTREIITEALQLRAKAGIKVRQPLSELRIMNNELDRELLEIIKEEVNVKEISVGEGVSEITELITELTPELILEGQAREIIRFIQEMRKEAGYEVDNRIRICYNRQSGVFERFGDIIKKETLADELQEGEMPDADLEKEFEIEGGKIKICIKKSREGVI